MTRHVVLGHGVVGRETAAALSEAGHEVAVVTQTPAQHPGVTAVVADLRDAASANRAITDADVAYLTIGLPYRTKVWRKDWPTILANTIQACIASGVHLVYFDNVYAYGRVNGPMTETSPIRPSSRKGEIRAELLQLLAAGRQRGLDYTVGRSADFYGPGATTSVFNTMALDRVAAGEEPTWLLDSSQPHSMTYTPDIGSALAVLGTDARGRGGVWHLPTAPALTGEEYLAMATEGKLRHRVMTMATMRFGALFIPDAREALEMAYQNTSPYVFDSTPFETTFGITATPYSEGVTRTLQAIRG
jgi:nucleoside-diphosphate-sugar epimerase